MIVFLVSTIFGSGNFLSLRWFARLSFSFSPTLLLHLREFFFPPPSPSGEDFGSLAHPCMGKTLEQPQVLAPQNPLIPTCCVKPPLRLGKAGWWGSTRLALSQEVFLLQAPWTHLWEDNVGAGVGRGVPGSGLCRQGDGGAARLNVVGGNRLEVAPAPLGSRQHLPWHGCASLMAVGRYQRQRRVGCVWARGGGCCSWQVSYF